MSDLTFTKFELELTRDLRGVHRKYVQLSGENKALRDALAFRASADMPHCEHCGIWAADRTDYGDPVMHEEDCPLGVAEKQALGDDSA